MKHDFDIGPEGWCSYDYEGCVRAGRNIFVLAAWSPTGRHRRLRPHLDESGRLERGHPRGPHLRIRIHAAPAMGRRGGSYNILGADVSLYLRGDGLTLHGARAYFWVNGGGATWHLEQPSS